MGLTKSYFRISYKLPTEEFHQLENEIIELLLLQHWIKLPLFTEYTEPFVPKDLTFNDCMLYFTKLMRKHVALNHLDTFPEVNNNREIDKVYVSLYRECLKLSTEQLFDGRLLYLELNTIQYPELALVTQADVDKFEDDPDSYTSHLMMDLLTKRAFRAFELYQADFSNISIFSKQFDNLYRKAYLKEYGIPYNSPDEVNAFFKKYG